MAIAALPFASNVIRRYENLGMLHALIDWDDGDDPSGNVQHIADNGLTPTEVEEVLRDPNSNDAVSRSSGRPIRFGWTSTGKHILVAYEIECDDPLVIYPVTAYEVAEPGGHVRNQTK
jgi:hypothetical protein